MAASIPDRSEAHAPLLVLSLGLRWEFRQMAYGIDFLAVADGERSGEVTALRYRQGDGKPCRIHVIDRGDQAAASRMVDRIQEFYANPTRIDAVVCTHGNDDQGSGLREAIKESEVGGIWMNRPWLYARLIMDDFKDKPMPLVSLERTVANASVAKAANDLRVGWNPQGSARRDA